MIEKKIEILKGQNKIKPDVIYLEFREIKDFTITYGNVANSKSELITMTKKMLDNYFGKATYFKVVKDIRGTYILLLETIELFDDYYKIMYFDELWRFDIKSNQKYISRLGYLSKIVNKNTLREFLKAENYIILTENNIIEHINNCW